jgi:hypothetical protein
VGIKPQSSKAKGRRGQQLLRDMILEIFPELEPDDVRSTAMGQNGADIQFSPAARKLLPYDIESKAKARAQVVTWYEQAKTHGDNEPLVFIKQDRKSPLIVVDAEHFLKLIRKLTDGNRSKDA